MIGYKPTGHTDAPNGTLGPFDHVSTHVLNCRSRRGRRDSIGMLQHRLTTDREAESVASHVVRIPLPLPLSDLQVVNVYAILGRRRRDIGGLRLGRRAERIRPRRRAAPARLRPRRRAAHRRHPRPLGSLLPRHRLAATIWHHGDDRPSGASLDRGVRRGHRGLSRCRRSCCAGQEHPNSRRRSPTSRWNRSNGTFRSARPTSGSTTVTKSTAAER